MTLTVLLLVTLAPATQQPLPESFAQRRLTLDVAVDYTAGALTGSVTMELENWTKAPARQISFVVGRLMTVSAASNGAGRPLPFSQRIERSSDEPLLQVDRVVVTLPRAVLPGGRAIVRLEYGGNLVGYTEVGWLYVKDHIDTSFTILRADALAFPVVGGLSRAANRMAPTTDFSYEVAVRVPAGYLVATGGAPTRVANPDGSVTWRYVSGTPSPFLNVSIARFDTLANEGVRLFYFRPDSAGARQVMANAQVALRLLATDFGPLHAPLHLTVTEIPDGWGSQASLVAGILQTAAAFRDSTRIGELYHELSHLWNVRDTDAPSPRWNEGLAMFLQDLLRERVNGWPGRDEDVRSVIARVKQRMAQDSTLRQVPFIEYGSRNMTGRSYAVGELMFATLYGWIGETDFNRIVGGYYQRFTTGGGTRDFVAFAERATDHDLTAFFDDWFFTTRWTDLVSSATSVADLVAHYTATAR